MKVIRSQEASLAAQSLHAKLSLLSFPDLHLPYIALQTLVEATLPLIREHQTDALFAFDSRGIDPQIDHLDHFVAGLVARQIGAAADVKHYLPDSPALSKRPALYLRTTTETATYHVPLSKKTRQRHNDYLINTHASQFSVTNQSEWVKIFDQLTQTKTGRHTERYFKVR